MISRSLRFVGSRINTTGTNVNNRLASSLVTKFNDSCDTLSMREAVRYVAKNRKWTAGDIKKYVHAHANALNEHGFKKGDSILVWLPESGEKHITLLAAATIGLKVYDMDTTISTVADIRASLTSSACKAIIFEPQTDTQDNLLLLRKSIPEFFDYDDEHGQSFHSKHWPALQYFIHTGFDVEMGALNYKHLFLHNPPVSAVPSLTASLSDDLPLYSTIKKSSKGIEVSDFIPQSKVLDQKAWSFASKILSNQYFEV